MKLEHIFWQQKKKPNIPLTNTIDFKDIDSNEFADYLIDQLNLKNWQNHHSNELLGQTLRDLHDILSELKFLYEKHMLDGNDEAVFWESVYGKCVEQVNTLAIPFKDEDLKELEGAPQVDIYLNLFTYLLSDKQKSKPQGCFI